MRILILDDDLTRHRTFAQNLDGHDVTHAQTYDICLKALMTCEPFDIVYLDHDLNDFGALSIGPSTSMYRGLRELDGRDVARFIAGQLPKNQHPKHIVVHSWNDDGGDEMMKILEPTGISLSRETFHPNIGR